MEMPFIVMWILYIYDLVQTSVFTKYGTNAILLFFKWFRCGFPRNYRIRWEK